MPIERQRHESQINIYENSVPRQESKKAKSSNFKFGVKLELAKTDQVSSGVILLKVSTMDHKLKRA